MDSKEAVKNLVIIGCAGSGKSSFCNALVSQPIFKVRKGIARQTHKTQAYYSPQLNLNVIDTYGFGQASSKVQDSQMAAIFLHLKPSEVIDAFVLVAPCNPHPSTLIKDLNCLVNRFGTAAYRSLLIAFVEVQSNSLPKDKFDEQIGKMDQLIQKFKEVGMTLNSCKYFQWNNKSPKAGQTEELISKASALEKYDTFKFIQAEFERRHRQEKEIQAKINAQIEQLKTENTYSTQEKQEMIVKLKTKQQDQKHDLVKRLEIQNQTVFESILEQMALKKQDKENLSNMIFELKKHNKQRLSKLAQKLGQDSEQYDYRLMEFHKLQEQSHKSMIQLMRKMAIQLKIKGSTQDKDTIQRTAEFVKFFNEMNKRFNLLLVDK